MHVDSMYIALVPCKLRCWLMFVDWCRPVEALVALVVLVLGRTRGNTAKKVDSQMPNVIQSMPNGVGVRYASCQHADYHTLHFIVVPHVALNKYSNADLTQQASGFLSSQVRIVRPTHVLRPLLAYRSRAQPPARGSAKLESQRYYGADGLPDPRGTSNHLVFGFLEAYEPYDIHT
jgi:hypothetical protein